ncbi:hypothetical protein Naga_100100g15 [Nannochloropsis gaditana]|uniref:Uncharacterized protein n=1 Tax=Nannochloropsis gaditana TaxID=72520 RepID=W7U3W8_9STRA|nr:hypothetical protein Naga_100100g15 [Nannochloropsis gaditana]
MEHHEKKYLPWQTPLAAAAFVPPLLGQEPNAVPLGRQVKLVPPSEERVARIIKQAHQKRLKQVRVADQRIAAAIRTHYRERLEKGKARVIAKAYAAWQRDKRERVGTLKARLGETVLSIGSGHRMAEKEVAEREEGTDEREAKAKQRSEKESFRFSQAQERIRDAGQQRKGAKDASLQSGRREESRRAPAETEAGVGEIDGEGGRRLGGGEGIEWQAEEAVEAILRGTRSKMVSPSNEDNTSGSSGVGAAPQILRKSPLETTGVGGEGRKESHRSRERRKGNEEEGKDPLIEKSSRDRLESIWEMSPSKKRAPMAENEGGEGSEDDSSLLEEQDLETDDDGGGGNAAVGEKLPVDRIMRVYQERRQELINRLETRRREGYRLPSTLTPARSTTPSQRPITRVTPGMPPREERSRLLELIKQREARVYRG